MLNFIKVYYNKIFKNQIKKEKLEKIEKIEKQYTNDPYIDILVNLIHS